MGDMTISGCHGRVQPRPATHSLFAQAETWRRLRQRAPGCWALQVRVRAEVGELTAEVHKIERNGGWSMAANATNSVLQKTKICATMITEARGVALPALTTDDLVRMERQLIPLLNTVRQMLGKRPVIVPGERRAGE